MSRMLAGVEATISIMVVMLVVEAINEAGIGAISTTLVVLTMREDFLRLVDMLLQVPAITQGLELKMVDAIHHIVVIIMVMAMPREEQL